MDGGFKKVGSVWIHSNQLSSYALYRFFEIELQKGNYKKVGTPPFNDKNYKKGGNLPKKGGNFPFEKGGIRVFTGNSCKSTCPTFGFEIIFVCPTSPVKMPNVDNQILPNV